MWNNTYHLYSAFRVQGASQVYLFEAASLIKCHSPQFLTYWNLLFISIMGGVQSEILQGCCTAPISYNVPLHPKD